MAGVDMGAIAERLFCHFMAPLVLGGEMRVGKPIGHKIALTLGEERTTIVDNELLSQVELARVRVARQLAPVDVLDPPTPEEWALGAVLHDLVLATHPDWRGLFLKESPRRLIELARLTLDEISAPETVGEALSRHTWFSRLLTIGRTDTKISWWVGSQTFLGTSPPTRLQAWPELRRVHVDTTVHLLTEFPTTSGCAPTDLFASVLSTFLERTPLTDLATCAREMPIFSWSRESLELLTTRAGLTLAARALATTDPKTNAALGAATRRLVSAETRTGLLGVIRFLGERCLAAALERLANREIPKLPDNADEAFCLALAAWSAQKQLVDEPSTFNRDQQMKIMAQLEPLALPSLVADTAKLLEPTTANSASLLG